MTPTGLIGMDRVIEPSPNPLAGHPDLITTEAANRSGSRVVTVVTASPLSALEARVYARVTPIRGRPVTTVTDGELLDIVQNSMAVELAGASRSSSEPDAGGFRHGVCEVCGLDNGKWLKMATGTATIGGAHPRPYWRCLHITDPDHPPRTNEDIIRQFVDILAQQNPALRRKT